MSDDINVGAISESLNNKVDLNQLNTNTQGLEYVSGLGMPSSKYIDLTLGASGATYTAPANGWVYLSLYYSANSWSYIGNVTRAYSIGGFRSTGITQQYILPVFKNDKFYVTYGAFDAQDKMFRLIYAEGSEPTA